MAINHLSHLSHVTMSTYCHYHNNYNCACMVLATGSSSVPVTAPDIIATCQKHDRYYYSLGECDKCVEEKLGMRTQKTSAYVPAEIVAVGSTNSGLTVTNGTMKIVGDIWNSVITKKQKLLLLL